MTTEPDTTAVSVYVTIIDADANPVTTFAAANIDTLTYIRSGGSPQPITPVDLASDAATWMSGGVYLVSPGVLRIDVPDAAFVTGVGAVLITLTGTDGEAMAGVAYTVELDNGERTLTAGERASVATAVWANAVPQIIRDAMKLAASAGAPAAGSIDAMVDGHEIEPEEPLATALTAFGAAKASDLTTIASDAQAAKVAAQAVQEKTDALLLTDGKVTTSNGFEATDRTKLNGISTAVATARLIHQSPVDREGSFLIVQGDDVSLVWSKAWTDSEPTAAVFRVTAFAGYKAGTVEDPLLETECTIELAEGTLTITAALTAAETDALPTSPPAGKYPLMAQVVLTVDGATQTLLLGRGEVTRKVG